MILLFAAEPTCDTKVRKIRNQRDGELEDVRFEREEEMANIRLDRDRTRSEELSVGKECFD